MEEGNHNVGGGGTEKVLNNCVNVSKECENFNISDGIGLKDGPEIDKGGNVDDGLVMDSDLGLNNRMDESTHVGTKKKEYSQIKIGSRSVGKSSGKQKDNVGVTEPQCENDNEEQEISSNRREKREVLPSSSVGSGGHRSRKKRKSCFEEAFGVKVEKAFNRGKVNEESTSNKKKVGRKSIAKPKEVAKRDGVVGLGDNEKGDYNEAGVNNEIFRFGNTKDDEVESNRCYLNMEHVKEIGEMIGVSWKATEEEVKRKMWDPVDNKENEVAAEPLN